MVNNSIFYTLKYNNDNTLHQVSQECITNINQPHLITTSNNHIHDNIPWLKNNKKDNSALSKGNTISKTKLSVSK